MQEIRASQPTPPPLLFGVKANRTAGTNVAHAADHVWVSTRAVSIGQRRPLEGPVPVVRAALDSEDNSLLETHLSSAS
jgi:hypothetical protein